MLVKRLIRTSQGQSLVELAMIAPVLLLLVLGVIDYGRVYFAYISVTNGARNGARYASENPAAAADLDGVRNVALTETNELLNKSPTNPGVSLATGTDSRGGLFADVTVSYTFTTIFPWPGLPNSMNVERTVRAMVGQ